MDELMASKAHERAQSTMLRAYYTHFDLSGLISMTRKAESSINVKIVFPLPGLEPGPPNFRSGVLTTTLQRQVTHESNLYSSKHPWMS